MTTAVLAIFLILVLVVSLGMLWPGLLRKLASRGVPTRTEALLGKTGTVTEAIDAHAGTGRVSIAGEDWAARSVTPLPAGAPVKVAGADGIVLNVLPVEPGAPFSPGVFP